MLNESEKLIWAAAYAVAYFRATFDGLDLDPVEMAWSAVTELRPDVEYEHDDDIDDRRMADEIAEMRRQMLELDSVEELL